MHVIESIGPFLGIAAFVGLAVLAFLLFQQARDIRRLREWSGRAPERAAEAADAVQAAADASREDEPVAPETEAAARVLYGGRVRSSWRRLATRARGRYASVDRRLPVDGRYILAAAVIALVAAAAATGGFGLVGGGGAGDADANHASSKAKPKPKVAVVNGTSVPGLAALVQRKVVKGAGYRSGTVGNATASVNATMVEYASGLRSQAHALAKAVKPKLGSTPVQPMTTDVKGVAGNAKLALVLGLDDAGFGGG